MDYTEIRYLTFFDIGDDGEQAIIDTSNSPAHPDYFTTDYHFKWCGTFFEVASTNTMNCARLNHFRTIELMGRAVEELDEATDENVYQYILEEFEGANDG